MEANANNTAANNKDHRPKRNLRSTLIEPFKQIKIGIYVMLLSLAFLVCASWLFIAAFTEQYQHVMEIFNVVDPSTKWELVTNNIFYSNAIKLGILFVSFIGILFTVVFRMTHRVYGPLISIERFVTHMAEGKYDQRLVIRRKDDLQKLAEQLNQMADKLQKRHGPHDRRRNNEVKSDSNNPKVS